MLSFSVEVLKPVSGNYLHIDGFRSRQCHFVDLVQLGLHTQVRNFKLYLHFESPVAGMRVSGAKRCNDPAFCRQSVVDWVVACQWRGLLIRVVRKLLLTN